MKSDGSICVRGVDRDALKEYLKINVQIYKRRQRNDFHLLTSLEETAECERVNIWIQSQHVSKVKITHIPLLKVAPKILVTVQCFTPGLSFYSSL